MLTVLSQVLSVLQASPQEVASQEGVAVSIDSVAEVLASDADLGAVAPCQPSIIDKIPFLHASPCKYVCTSSGDLVLAIPLHLCCGLVTSSRSSLL